MRVRGGIPVPTGIWTGIVPSGQSGPLTSLCREGEGWERKTQFFWEGNTPWTRSFAGIGGSCRKKGQNSPQTPGWDRLGASNTFNALEFFPFPSLAPGLVLPVPWAWWQWLHVLAVSWDVTSLSPGTEPWGTPGWDLLAWELLFWERRDQSLTLGWEFHRSSPALAFLQPFSVTWTLVMSALVTCGWDKLV